jgi:hypothetical protein
MQKCSAQMADFIRSRVQSPTAFVIAQLPAKLPSNAPAGTTPVYSQMVIDKVTGVQITRSTDRTSDTCSFTLQDDTFDYSSFQTVGNNKYGVMFQPGNINNIFNVYLGFQGQNFTNPQGLSGNSNATYGTNAILRYTGILQTDDNSYATFSNKKTVSLIDMTSRFSFDVYDTFPHPIYGDQTLAFFDPSYNLSNDGDGVTWNCIGKMFTTDSSSLVYGSTHLDPKIFIDFSCGQNPQNTALGYDHSSLNTSTFIATYFDSSGNPLWTFDYPNGQIIFTELWITDQMAKSPPTISQLQANYTAGHKVFAVNQIGNFVVGGTVILGRPNDPHQEQLTIASIQTGAGTITTTKQSQNSHSNGDPVMGNWVVSMAGNPTYMNPDQMVKLILCTKGGWPEDMVSLDQSHVLIPQYVGQDMAAWDCLKEICDLTCPRFLPWVMYVDLDGVIHFEESMYDAPVVKKFIDSRDFLDLDISFTSQNISTVVRAEGECYTDQGAQSVTALAFNQKLMQRYGQTEALLLDQHLTYNTRNMTTTQAVGYMNMLCTSVLGQVSEPVMTITADIWPDPTLDINDKIQVHDTDLGIDIDFVITAINETLGPATYGMQITAQQAIYPANYLTGLPSALTYDSLLLPAVDTIPATSLVKEVRLGTGVGKYVYLDWNPTRDPTTMQDIIGEWQLGSEMHFDVFFDAKPTSIGDNPYSYKNLPPGPDWVPSQNPQTGDTVYYAVQPSTPIGTPANAGWELYVGPDSIFYTFDHSPPIAPADLGSFWLPPGNDHTPGQGTGTKDWTGYVWAWWYLCLDGSEGTGKFYRPTMLLRPGGNDPPATFTISGGSGHQLNIPWNSPPGPTNDAHSYYYGNIVAGISNLVPTPPGFFGTQVYRNGGGSGKTAVNWPDSNPFWSDSHGNGGPGWMPPNQTSFPVVDSTQIVPGDHVTIGVGNNMESNVPISAVGATTLTIDPSYNGGLGTMNHHYGGPKGQADASGYPPAAVVAKGPGGGMPDTIKYGVAFGPSISQQDVYVNYEKTTYGMFCFYVMSTDGATQFLRLPFKLYL